MKVDVVLGLQWGDEGKGKIVDVLAKSYPAVARAAPMPATLFSLKGKSLFCTPYLQESSERVPLT